MNDSSEVQAVITNGTTIETATLKLCHQIYLRVVDPCATPHLPRCYGASVTCVMAQCNLFTHLFNKYVISDMSSLFISTTSFSSSLADFTNNTLPFCW